MIPSSVSLGALSLVSIQTRHFRMSDSGFWF